MGTTSGHEGRRKDILNESGLGELDIPSLSTDFNTKVGIDITSLLGKGVVDVDVVEHGVELGLILGLPEAIVAIYETNHIGMDEEAWVKG